ncbi:MAG: ABC transporter substrate-binding protein [Alphaproteobacteria bacterium]|nr:ABC transporter substrate-binding protein [Alphaproteobacteria bacterium]
MTAVARLARGLIRLGFPALLLGTLVAAPARAETGTVRIAQQFGISYLPLTIMSHEKLLEQAAAKAGIADLKIVWTQFAAGNAMNEGLLSGNLDFASGGVAPLLTIWSKTKGRLEIKGVAALNSMPLYLTVIKPEIKTLADLKDTDRIGLPAVKVSIQAVTLQMAAEQQFGAGHFAQLDPLTVSMAHPDAMAAMMTGKSEISGHFGSAPFQYQELQDKRVHRLLSSYDVLGGPATFNVVWTTKRFRDLNPKIYSAFLTALEEAEALINQDPHHAAEIYIEAEKSKLPLDFVLSMLHDPENVFTTTPQNVMKYAAFMAKTGSIENMPKAWTELFFPDIQQKQGS